MSSNGSVFPYFVNHLVLFVHHHEKDPDWNCSYICPGYVYLSKCLFNLFSSISSGK